MDEFIDNLDENLYFLSIPKVGLVDLLEMFILAFAIYHIILWVKSTRAWSLLKGIIVLFLCYVFAYVLDMSVILWIFNKTVAIGITAIMIVFQPELRKALDELGRKNIVKSIIPISFDDQKDKNKRFSDRTVNEIARATVELAKAKTGALMVIEKEISLSEYIRTGINVDSAISSQLLINIFEKNTPLHDGAVIIRGDRIVAATCYLPISDNLGLSKDLGTRHRAGVGISEVSDSLTIIVSEETGKISLALNGKLFKNIDGDLLKEKMRNVQGSSVREKRRHLNFALKARSLRGKREE